MARRLEEERKEEEIRQDRVSYDISLLPPFFSLNVALISRVYVDFWCSGGFGGSSGRRR